MKKILFFIAIFGLMLIGTNSPAFSINVTFNFGNMSCPAWCCYLWQMKVFEWDGGSSYKLIDTEPFDCSTNSYTFSESVDPGYYFLIGTVTAFGSSVCDPAPSYSNWTSSPYYIQWPYLVTWYPYICG